MVELLDLMMEHLIPPCHRHRARELRDRAKRPGDRVCLIHNDLKVDLAQNLAHLVVGGARVDHGLPHFRALDFSNGLCDPLVQEPHDRLGIERYRRAPKVLPNRLRLSHYPSLPTTAPRCGRPSSS